MSLTDKINTDIRNAMLAKEQVKLATLRAIKSALLLEATKGGATDVSDEMSIKIMTKLYKQRKESAEIYIKQDRQDLAEAELAEAKVLEEYLPTQLGEDEIRAIVNEIVTSSGASSMADMGKVMGQASAKMAGKADGKLISGIVKELLS